jgi:hypothetical protein
MLGASEYGIGPGTSPGVLVNRTPIPEVGASKAGQDYSELGVWNAPGYAGPFTGRSSVGLVEAEASDTAYLSAVESPVDSQELTTYDVASLSSTEAATFLRTASITDTASLSASEAVSLNISGVLASDVTDTASVAASEVVALDVILDATDTASIQADPETGIVDESGADVAVTDLASISVADSASVDIFAGLIAASVSDTAWLLLDEVGAIAVVGSVGESEGRTIRLRARSRTIRRVH